MNLSLIRTIAVLALFTVITSGLFLSVSVAVAEGTDSENTPIDMETDDDGNGIPDEFEAEYRELLAALASMSIDSMNLKDIYESEVYKALRDFYERLPIAAFTKQVLDQHALAFQKLAAVDSLEKQREALDDILKEEKELRNQDPVYARAVKYIRAITLPDMEGGSGSNADGLSDVGRVAGEGGILPSQGSGRRHHPVSTTDSTTEENLEDRINQVGDIIFRDTRGATTTSTGSYTAEYIMDWSHVGVFAGNSLVYDADNSGCPPNSNASSGVANRPISRFYRQGYYIKYSQLATASWRSSEEDALEDAQDEYSTSCETPFSLNVFHPQRTDTFHCSSLVWRIYRDNEDHPVNVDSNHANYRAWLEEEYNWLLARFIINSAIAPDEIALDPDLNHYYYAYIENLVD